MTDLRYSAAACQIDLPNPETRNQIGKKVGKMLTLTEQAVAGYAPFLPVKLVVFPEFAHAAPIHDTAAALRKHLTVEIPNEHTERYADKAKELDIYIQTGTFLEEDPD